MTTVDITTKAPENFITLAWDIFYGSRQRGISRAANLPWLNDEHTFFVTLREGHEILGGLAVRRVKRSRSDVLQPHPASLGHVAGIIGMVCVRPDHRGKGLSQVALMAAISEAGRLGTDDLILWTSKPQVYEGLGFVLDDRAASGSVRGAVVPRDTPPPLRTAWPVPDSSSRGLPPYARAGWRWTTQEASVIVIEDPTGVILCEWSGHDAHVAELLAHAMPPTWRLHTLTGDTLSDELARRGWIVDSTPSRLQMRLQLRRRDDVGDPYRLRVLDRI